MCGFTGMHETRVGDPTVEEHGRGDGRGGADGERHRGVALGVAVGDQGGRGTLALARRVLGHDLVV